MKIPHKNSILATLVVALFIAIFGYIFLLLSDILFYERSISQAYDLPTQINSRSYDGDYVASIIDAKSVKISLIAIIISALGSILTFVAFIVQKRANEIHREDIKNEHLIANYTKLMDTHRDIVKSVTVNKILNGYDAFHFLFYELKSIYVHLVQKHPFMRDKEYKDVASYICLKLYMSGSTGGDDSKLIETIFRSIGEQYREKINLQEFTNSLEKLNHNFVNKRKAPAGFIMAKYKKAKEFPILPPLYKGHLQQLSSYFNLIDMFMSLEDRESSTQTMLYRKMFAMQLSIHESAILDFYFRFKSVESNARYDASMITLLCEQRLQFPATFDIDNELFCKGSN